MSLKRVRDTDQEFDAAFERFLSTSRTQHAESSSPAQRPSSVLEPDHVSANGLQGDEVTPALQDQGHSGSGHQDPASTTDKVQTNKHDTLNALIRQPSEPLSASREEDARSEISNSNAGPSRASSLQRETSCRPTAITSGRLGSAHPALDVWARRSQTNSLKDKQRLVSGSSDHETDNERDAMQRSNSRNSLPPQIPYHPPNVQASSSVPANGQPVLVHPQYYPVVPKKKPAKLLLDEHGNVIRRKVGRPRTKPLRPANVQLDEHGNIVRRKVGRPRLRPLSPNSRERKTSSGYVQVKMEPGMDNALLPKEDPAKERLLCLPIPTEHGVPNRAETHTLFVSHSHRLAWIVRHATHHVEHALQASNGATDDETAALPWVRWTTVLGYPEFAPHLGPSNSKGASIGDASALEASPANKQELRPRLFPKSGLDAYRAVLKSHFSSQRAPRDHLSVARLLTHLRKHTPCAIPGEPSIDQKPVSKRKQQPPEKLARKAFKQRRPTTLDARHLWTVWAKKAHAMQSPRKNVAFPLLEDSASEARQELLRDSPPPSSTASGEPPSPSKMLRFSMPQEVEEESSKEESPLRRKTAQLPFLRRNLRVYAKLGYPTPQLPSEESKQ